MALYEDIDVIDISSDGLMALLAEDDSDDDSVTKPKTLKSRKSFVIDLQYIDREGLYPVEVTPSATVSADYTVPTDIASPYNMSQWLYNIALNEAMLYARWEHRVAGKVSGGRVTQMLNEQYGTTAPVELVDTTGGNDDARMIYLEEILYNIDGQAVHSSHGAIGNMYAARRFNKESACVLVENGVYLGHVYFDTRILKDLGSTIRLIGIRSSMMAIHNNVNGVAIGILCGLIAVAERNGTESIVILHPRGKMLDFANEHMYKLQYTFNPMTNSYSWYNSVKKLKRIVQNCTYISELQPRTKRGRAARHRCDDDYEGDDACTELEGLSLRGGWDNNVYTRCHGTTRFNAPCGRATADDVGDGWLCYQHRGRKNPPKPSESTTVQLLTK